MRAPVFSWDDTATMEDSDLEAWSLEPTIEEQEEEEAALISASITDDQLRALTGSHQLDTVDFLQMAVDSSCVPLDTLGERLPRLEQLKLNGSSLPSIRELGTSLSHLRVLWLCRCGLAELDGMSALPELQEWLRSCAEGESDAGCQQLAVACHAAFGGKMRSELASLLPPAE